jgi:branched-chain amino acid transport system ATP-binding protein
VVVQAIFSLIQKIRNEGYTVLIVEQNVRQVLGVVDRAYLMETGRMRASGSAAEMLANDAVRTAYLGI